MTEDKLDKSSVSLALIKYVKRSIYYSGLFEHLCLICHQNLFKFKNANRVTDYLVEDFQEMSLYKFLLTKKKSICIIEWNYS